MCNRQQQVQSAKLVFPLSAGIDQLGKPEQKITGGRVDVVARGTHQGASRPVMGVPPTVAPIAPPNHRGPAAKAPSTWLPYCPLGEPFGAREAGLSSDQLTQFPVP